MEDEAGDVACHTGGPIFVFAVGVVFVLYYDRGNAVQPVFVFSILKTDIRRQVR